MEGEPAEDRNQCSHHAKSAGCDRATEAHGGSNLKRSRPEADSADTANIDVAPVINHSYRQDAVFLSDAAQSLNKGSRTTSKQCPKPAPTIGPRHA
jgi:hypothetical protein